MTKCGTQENVKFVNIPIYIRDMTKTAVSCVPLIDLDQFSETASLHTPTYKSYNIA